MTRFPFFLAALSSLSLATAQETVGFSAAVESIESADWQVLDFQSHVEFADSGIRAAIRIRQIKLMREGVTLDDTRVDCGQVMLSRTFLRCDNARLTAGFPGIGRVTVPASFVYERISGATRFNLRDVPVAGGNVQLRGTTGEAGTRAEFTGIALQIAPLIALANTLGFGPGAVDASGSVTFSGSAKTAGNGDIQLGVTAVLDGASVANEAGTLVTDAIDGKLNIEVSSKAGEWLFDVDVAAGRGEVYVEPVYANLAEHALTMRASGVRTSDFRSYQVGEFYLDQASQVTVAGQGSIKLAESAESGPTFSGEVDVSDTSLEAIYVSVLRILAAGTILGDLETAGRVSGHLAVRENILQSATVTLDNLILDDLKRRFALYGLNGTVHWPGTVADAGETRASRVRWDSGNAYNIELGDGDIEARLGAADFELLTPLRVPTMGGAVVINQLLVRDYGTDEASGLLDAELEPVQLGQLSGAFGWPAFSGSLAGKLPLLQYQGNAMTVGGTLTASAFGGDIEISGLRIAQPFGRVPRLAANIRLRQLDLERLTNTFSFGLIQGRLSGEVTGLSMVNWRPVAMDLHLYTPQNDRTPHRISQRAVENLASVGGGGAAAALSSGLLKFFEVFAYDRIALRCVLRDGACAMSGAGPAGDGPLGRGFYIVKGKGVPRIDVVGYRSNVNWSALVRQLENITRSDAPVVK